MRNTVILLLCLALLMTMRQVYAEPKKVAKKIRKATPQYKNTLSNL